MGQILGGCDGQDDLKAEVQSELENKQSDINEVEDLIRDYEDNQDTGIIIHLYNHDTLFLSVDNEDYIELHNKLMTNKRFRFSYDSNRYLLKMNPPRIYSFDAPVAAILTIGGTDQQSFRDMKSQVEILFFEGTPRKRVYAHDSYVEFLAIGSYYRFNCVIDDGIRSHWYRVLTADLLPDYKKIDVKTKPNILWGK